MSIQNSEFSVTENASGTPVPVPRFKPTFNRPAPNIAPKKSKVIKNKEKKVIPSFSENLVGASKALRGVGELKLVPLKSASFGQEDRQDNFSEIEVFLILKNKVYSSICFRA